MKRVFCIVMMIMALVVVPSCRYGNEPSKENAEEKTESITIYSLKDDTLCPVLTDNDANRQMLGIVYESLVKLKSDMDAEGVLAESWSVSPDGLIWTFNLRKGVKWHNGESFSAEDVVYTINQIKTAQPISYSYNVRHIENAEAMGNSVVITLNEPCPLFVNLMTFPIVKKSEEDINRESFYPVGTGAYIFPEKAEGNVYVLKRNDLWWGGKAKLDEIKVKILPDSETIAYSFSSGNIDIADAKWGQSKQTGIGDLRKTPCPLPVYDFIGINHNDLVLKNKEVRKAISYAIRREKIVNDIFAGNGIKANAPVRDGWFLSEEKGDYKADSVSAENFLLKNEWKKDGGAYSKKTSSGVLKPEFELIVNEENSSRINIAESVKLDMEAIGMNVRVVPLPFEEYENRISSEDYQMFLGSVMIPDDVDLTFLVGNGNMFSYQNEKMDKILADIKNSQNRDTLIKNYGRFKNLFVDELPIVGICFENFDMIYSKKVKGVLEPTMSNRYMGIYNLYTGK